MTLTAEDRFCLDGQRLMLLNPGDPNDPADPGDTYGGDGVEYRTELNTFARIVSYTGGPAGEYFKVWRKDGSVSEYGATADSRLEAPGTAVALTWAQNRFADSTNVAINYFYNNTPDPANPSEIEITLDRIEYAYGDDSQSGARVQFNYESRPDAYFSYANGVKVVASERLSNIQVFNELVDMPSASNLPTDSDGKALVRQYDIEYASANGRADAISLVNSITECAGGTCKPPTVFDWTDNSPVTYSAVNTLNGAADDYRGGLPADVNGDGRQDWIWIHHSDPTSNSFSIHVLQSNGISLTSETATGRPGHFESFQFWGVLDHNVDGYSDLFVIEAVDEWKVYYGSPSGLAQSPTTIPDLGIVESASQIAQSALLADVNSDGLVDFTFNATIGNSPAFAPHVLYLTASGGFSNEPVLIDDSSALIDFEEEIANASIAAGIQDWLTYVPNIKTGGPQGIDFNGDGRVDAVVTPEVTQCPIAPEASGGHVGEFPGHDCFNEQPLGLLVAVEDSDSEPAYELYDSVLGAGEYAIGDINGDGLSDVIFQNGIDTLSWRYKLNNGQGLEETSYAINVVDPSYAPFTHLTDVNRDGYLDFVFRTDNEIKALVWEGDAFAQGGTAGDLTLTSTHAAISNGGNLLLDFSGDGVADYVQIHDDNVITRRANNVDGVSNRVEGITNGLGVEVDIHYGPLTDSTLYTKGQNGNGISYPGKTSPIFDFLGPMYVVEQVDRSAPIDGDADHKTSLSYQYAGARMQAGGRGFLGFEQLSIVDASSGLKTEQVFRQDFPFTGMPSSTKTFLASSTVPLSETTYDYELGSKENVHSDVWTPLLDQTIAITRFANTTPTAPDFVAVGAVRSTVTTDYGYDNAFGNISTLVEETEDEVGVKYTRSIVNSYDDKNDTPIRTTGSGNSTWHLGRLTGVTATHSSTDPNRAHPNPVRHSSFDYDPVTGLLTDEYLEPGTVDQVRTHYDHDDYGNVTDTQYSGSNVTSRSVTRDFDSSGRYVDSVVNALDQTVQTVEERNELGQPLRITDIDNVATEFRYGAFGDRYFQRSDLGVFSRVDVASCVGSSCPAVAAYQSTATLAGGASSTVFYDKLSRPIKQSRSSLGSADSVVSTQYDERGRAFLQTLPHFENDSSYATEASFDVLNRPIKIEIPEAPTASTGGVNTTTIEFSGNTVLTTNGLGQKKLEKYNVLGELIEATDGLDTTDASSMTYGYDVYGNMDYVASLLPGGGHENAIEIAFDKLGRKTSMDDPDKGLWHYKYNAFGEMTEQTDAKGQVSDIKYDALGRLESRKVSAPGQSGLLEDSSWTYVSGNNNGLGQLQARSDAVSGFTDSYVYDDLGRVVELNTTIPGQSQIFSQRISYDEFSRVHQQQDVVGGRIGNSYSKGIMTQVRDLDTSVVYSQIQALDARGNITEELLGNDITNARSYDPVTGLPDTIIATTSSGLRYQELDLDFDLLGNLKSRVDLGGDKNIEDTFDYDHLNRLDTHKATATDENSVETRTSLTLQYDYAGNIAYKSDVGTYAYGENGAGPHAVTSAGPVEYDYDANGNMISDGTLRHIEYASFDKPTKITTPLHETKFQYGPGRSRYRRTDTNISEGSAWTSETLYLGNVEIITRSDGENEVRRNINGNVVIVEPDNTEVRVLYLHKDHLGSMDVILDANGAPVNSFSFDPFGQRRSTLGLHALPEFEMEAVDDVTTRGFGSHEMIEESGLVHMNGRVYDPRLGRFTSADPFVQAPDYSQSFNRYSYVFNNPGSYTDPSGYIGEAAGAGNLFSFSIPGSAFLFALYFLESENLVKPVFGQAASSSPSAISMETFSGTSRWALAVSGNGRGIVTDRCMPRVSNRNCHGRYRSRSKRSNFELNAGIEPATVIAFIPIIGDVMGVKEAIENPTVLTVSIALIQFIPIAGDGAGVTLKTVDDIPVSGRTISASSPNEIAWGFGELSRRQQGILDQLSGPLARTTMHKNDISITDLAALTARTGDEFALFTNGSQRLVVRGNARGVPIDRSELQSLSEQGYRWSAHTHPGTLDKHLDASGFPGDREVLRIFNQEQSVILNSSGARSVFNRTNNIRIE